MNRTRWIIFGVICVAILGLLILTNKKDSASFNGDATKVITEGSIQDHVFGSNAQKVILIEYGDYQCPACGAMYQTVKNITTQYEDKLTFVFRNFPLTGGHPNALFAATAAEAAGKQGKYYEMHDKLYEMQTAWSSASITDRTGIFEGYAKSLGLNMDQYRKDIGSSDIANKISRDQTTAKTFGVDSTPTFVLDGKKLPIETGTSPNALQQVIEDALKKAGLL